MAKAREIPGLDARMPFAEAAAATVAVRAEELFEHSENVLDMTDIERVHDGRSAGDTARRGVRARQHPRWWRTYESQR